MTQSFLQGGSEYGGVPGLIQPLPHSIADSAAEQASLTVRTDPSDPLSSPTSVLEKEDRERRHG
jgi:hypothetical protein